MDDLNSIVKEAAVDAKTGAEIAEMTSLSAYQDKYQNLILRSEKQKISLKRWAISFTFIALSAFGTMEALILIWIMQSEENQVLINLAFAPIVAITAILSVFLFGTFQPLRSKDLAKLPVGGLPPLLRDTAQM